MKTKTIFTEVADWVKKDLRNYFSKINYKIGIDDTTVDTGVDIEFTCSGIKKNIKNLKRAIKNKLKYLKEDILDQFEVKKDSYISVRVNNYLGKWYVDIYMELEGA